MDATRSRPVTRISPPPTRRGSSVSPSRRSGPRSTSSCPRSASPAWCRIAGAGPSCGRSSSTPAGSCRWSRRSAACSSSAIPGFPARCPPPPRLYAGLQIIMPGEAAPSHHHTPAALRLVVEGRGAFTTVEGVRCEMEPGDLIITPPMRWHDHGHEGAEPVIWLDGLDIPLVRAFEASWASKMRPAQRRRRPPTPRRTSSPRPGLVPRGSRYPETGYPQVRWPWREVREALARLAATAPREQAVTLRYVNPRTGAPPLATMGSRGAVAASRRGHAGRAAHGQRRLPRDRGARGDPRRRHRPHLGARRLLRRPALAVDRAPERIRRRARRALPPQRRARAPLAGAVAGRDTGLTRLGPSP